MLLADTGGLFLPAGEHPLSPAAVQSDAERLLSRAEILYVTPPTPAIRQVAQQRRGSTLHEAATRPSRSHSAVRTHCVGAGAASGCGAELPWAMALTSCARDATQVDGGFCQLVIAFGEVPIVNLEPVSSAPRASGEGAETATKGRRIARADHQCREHAPINAVRCVFMWRGEERRGRYMRRARRGGSGAQPSMQAPWRWRPAVSPCAARWRDCEQISSRTPLNSSRSSQLLVRARR